MKKILAIGLAILTTACADNSSMLVDYGTTNTKEVQKIAPAIGYQALEQATLCCESLSELDYQPVTRQGKLDLTITQKNQAFKFNTGKSYVQGITLPEANGAIKVTISAPIVDSVFVPTVLVLDEQYKPIQVYSEETIRLEKASLLNISRFFGEIELPKITDGQQAKYLVVLTTEKEMKETTKAADLYKPHVKNLDRPYILSKIKSNQPIAHTAIGAVRLAFDYLPNSQTSAQEMVTETATDNDQQKAQALLIEESEAATVLKETPVSSAIQPESEAMFIQLIEQAIKNDESDKALRFVEEAELAGSTKARDALFDALKKYKK